MSFCCTSSGFVQPGPVAVAKDVKADSAQTQLETCWNEMLGANRIGRAIRRVRFPFFELDITVLIPRSLNQHDLLGIGDAGGRLRLLETEANRLAPKDAELEKWEDAIDEHYRREGKQRA
jgi:hypothetical protein